jgi:hypothetical protein
MDNIDSPLDGQELFPVQTPYWITQKWYTSQRLNKILHVWTKRTNKELSQDYGYYPRDVHAKKQIAPPYRELVHFHRNTVDAQGICKLLRTDISKQLISVLSLQEHRDFTKVDNKYLFTAQQAQACIERLPLIKLWNMLYTARLLTQQDIVTCLSFFGPAPIDTHFDQDIFSPHRRSLAHLWNFCPQQNYILDEGKGMRITCSGRKESMGVVSGLLPQAKWLIKLALDRATLPDEERRVLQF